MAVKTYKSMTNGTRGMSTIVNSEITKTTPEKIELSFVANDFLKNFMFFTPLLYYFKLTILSSVWPSV